MALAEEINFLFSVFGLIVAAVVLFFLFLWIGSQVSEARTEARMRTLSSVARRPSYMNDASRAHRRQRRGYAETDLRLTYKRFKELYPFSQISYQEYKQLQARKAFRRAVSSEKIKRMVR
jgi:hypothetical protein